MGGELAHHKNRWSSYKLQKTICRGLCKNFMNFILPEIKFNVPRYRQLIQMNVQPISESFNIDKEHQRRLFEDYYHALY